VPAGVAMDHFDKSVHQERPRREVPLRGAQPDGKKMAETAQKNKQNAAPTSSLYLEGSRIEQPEDKGTAAEAKAGHIAACFRLIAQGKVAALGDLYDLTAVDLYGYIRSILGSASEAEDVFQEVFARIAARGPKLIKVEKPLAYMFTIARNEAFGVLSKRAARRRIGEDAALFEEPAAEHSDAPTLTANEAAQALAELPDDQREAVVLKIYEGFTFAEIAGITEVSANTVASRYRYGLMKLAKLLGRTIKEE
jgi:RNA polymerase sigma-70 factor, ECF subfamily